jgi:hypothetical protein
MNSSFIRSASFGIFVGFGKFPNETVTFKSATSIDVVLYVILHYLLSKKQNTVDDKNKELFPPSPQTWGPAKLRTVLIYKQKTKRANRGRGGGRLSAGA